MIERVRTFVEIAARDDAWDVSVRSQDAASAGREDLHLKINRPHYQPDRHVCQAGESGSALDEIVTRADSHSLIIINEHHAEPRHRIFISELAARLRRKGFTHYAAEAFASTGIEGTGYPQTGDGYYTSEPMMARSVYRLRQLGYELVAYEARQDQFDPFEKDAEKQIRDREEAQALNLMEAVLGKAPDTKILVHVGHGHAAEFTPSYPGAIPWMAARLKEKSGIDPLTIDLTMCRSEGDAPIFSIQAITPDGMPIGKATDYLVGFPAKTFERGRPAYRRVLGDRFVEVPGSLQSQIGPIMIEARPLGASLEQSPIERLVLLPGDDIPLLLPQGEWSLVRIDETGAVTARAEVLVE
ncbi:MAG: hypothetical protein AAGA89_03510 [Pseudomonadota bacterium]